MIYPLTKIYFFNICQQSNLAWNGTSKFVVICIVILEKNKKQMLQAGIRNGSICCVIFNFFFVQTWDMIIWKINDDHEVMMYIIVCLCVLWWSTYPKREFLEMPTIQSHLEWDQWVFWKLVYYYFRKKQKRWYRYKKWIHEVEKPSWC